MVAVSVRVKPFGPVMVMVTVVPAGTLVSVPERSTLSLGPTVAGSGAGLSTGTAGATTEKVCCCGVTPVAEVVAV